MKRKIAFFLVFSLIFSSFFALTPLSAYAEETELTDEYSEDGLLGRYSPSEIYALYPEAGAYIASQLRELSDSIDLRAYQLNGEDMGDIFYSAVSENPDIFYVLSNVINVTATYGGTVVRIQPQYTFDKAEIPAAVERFNKAAEKILSGVDSSWDEITKARYIHDMLAQYTEYALDYASISNSDPDFYEKMRIYNAYGALVDNKAVCEGYTMAYDYLLSRVGVRGCYVRSAVARHAWSMVQIGGKYYHVDVTHDDPIYDNLGRANHNNFLKSDAFFAADGDENHVKWIFGEKADDTSLDNMWWNEIGTAIYRYNGEDYYVDRSFDSEGKFAIVARNAENGNERKIYKSSAKWSVKENPGYFWVKAFSFLTADDEYFYFNDTNNIFRLKKGESAAETVYTKPDNEENDIYGMAFGADGSLYVSIKENPNIADTVIKTEIQAVENAQTQPVTEAPTTAEPTTAEPTTEAPTTAEPTTAEPTTEAPTTAEPTTAEPTTEALTTAEPTTAEPITKAPTTAEPTTAEPTTEAPTTAEPTTAEPTTEAPTTAEPTTAEPTTEAPKPKVVKKTKTLYLKYKAEIIISKDGPYTYTTSNKKIATVNSKGIVTAKKAGKVVITAKSDKLIVKFTVTVKNPTLNKTKLTLKKGKSFTLKIKGGTGKITFKSSNKKIVSVSSKGKLKAVKKGKATITVSVSGIKLKCKITVK